MRKHPLRLMIITMAVAYGLLIITVATGRSPKLGLDLQGGISVVLQPVENGKVVDAKAEQLDQAIEIIRKRVDALGVAEPEVSRQGNTVQVQLPGAKDQQEVLDVVGQTAVLEFRPVLNITGSVLRGKERTEAEEKVAALTAELALPEGVTATQILQDEQAKQSAAATPTTTPEPATTTTAAPATTTTAVPATTADPTANSGGNRSARVRAQDDATSTTIGSDPAPGADPAPDAATDAPTDTPTSTTVPPTPLNQWGINVYDERFGELYQLETQLNSKVTPEADVKKDGEVTLAGEDGTLYTLGPVALDGKAVDTASAGVSPTGEWTVNLAMKGGAAGIDKFNAIAAKCYAGDATCPKLGSGGPDQNGMLGIVLDNEVLSAPSINTPSFTKDQIQISGSFDEEGAKALAAALRYGSLPIQLEPQQAETVSATLGKGALEAGIIAGLIGLALVCAYLLLYYRLLGLMTIGALTISASFLWVIMSNLSATVTLAGVVGIVVSIGISLDSSVVFFESLKEDVRGGASLRSSAEKSFSTAYSTIIKADISSLIGAAVLYWLSVGPVRGFAFYLGVATVLDLVSAYLFLRPGVVVLARSGQSRHPGRFGIPMDDLPAARTDGAAPATVGAPAGEEARA